MRKILIISYLFAPNNDIGAVRPSKIAGLLAHRGHTVDVISYGMKGNDSFPLPDNIHEHYMMSNQQFCIPCKSISEKSRRKRSNTLVQSVKQHYRTSLLLKNGKQFVDYCKKLYKGKLVEQQYDILITSFGPPASLQCGLFIKKLSPHIKWLCDFRDPIVTEDSPLLYLPYYKHLQSKACRVADHIVAVSNGYLRRICGNKYMSKRHMIPNGYDTADIAISESCIPPTDLLHITYVGALYEGKRKITPLFRALRELANEGKVDLNKICFDYAGGDGAFLCAQADEFGFGSIVHDHGVLPRNECLKLQFSSHLLVLSTWNNRGEEGVFPGKFLEYMLIGKPIISITDGNLPNSEVTSVMREGRLGVAYETARANEDFSQLKQYVYACYTEWAQKGSITFEPVQEVLDRYNYDHIIKQIEGLICGE